MTDRDRHKVISQIYKFETSSTFIFALTLISCHLEFSRVKLSVVESQQRNFRTYASRLSILSATLVLMWVFGLTTFYLSLALVYGHFTSYFLWPTILLTLMASSYLSQIVQTLLKLKYYTDNLVQQYDIIFIVYSLLTLLVVPMVYYFETIILSNTLTTLLSGSIWFP